MSDSLNWRSGIGGVLTCLNLPSVTVGWWMGLCFLQYSLNMFLFLLCHFLSSLTFLHHGTASLWQCMLSSTVCKYMSVSYDVFWCLLNCECFIITQLMRKVLKGKLSLFTCSLHFMEQEKNWILFSSQRNYNEKRQDKTHRKAPWRYHKSGPYDWCAEVHVFWSYTIVWEQ